MKRLLALLGGLALVRVLLRRRPAPPPPPEPADARADDLRRKLDESRTLVGEQEEFASGETPVDSAGADDRRRDVHDRGRSAIDEMRRRPSD